MSIFGNPLPYEDNTAASLIRRGGYPPEETYNQKPEVYQCPCCSEFAQAQERERLVRAANAQKELERRRLMQLDIFDERAKPIPPPSQKRRHSYRAIGAPVEEPQLEPQSDVPAPPATLDELRRARQQAAEANLNSAAKLIVTVHHGENLAGAPRDPLSVIVRCGAFEGRTAKVPRGKEALTTWDELFEFPYPNSEEPLEVLVVNDSLPDTNEHLLGGVVVPSDALHDRENGNEELIPVMPEDQMQSGYGAVKEGPLGTIVASWYVSEDGQNRGLDASALEHQRLDQTQVCTFVAHHVFQYTDNGSEPFPGGVLCVLRDTDDNCSESVLYKASSIHEPSMSPFFGKEGYHYMPENPSQMMELHTDKKLGHILVCVPKDESAAADEEEELIVVGAVPLDFERLHNKGSAVLLVESKSKEDALWGEIQIEWLNKTATEAEEAPRQIEQVVQEESLFVTAMRGLNLTDRNGAPVQNAHVVVTTEELEGAGTAADAEVDGDGNSVIPWNQEIRFIGVEPNEESIEVCAFSEGRPISTGRCLIRGEEGNVVVEMHDVHNGQQHLGDVVVDYKRLHAAESGAARAIAAPAEDAAEEAAESSVADEEAEKLEQGEPTYPREHDAPVSRDAEDARQERALHKDHADADAIEEEADAEKPQLYTDADDRAADEEDENPFEEQEEEEEAPVAESRAVPVPEGKPTKVADKEQHEDDDPLEEEEESMHAMDEPANAAEQEDAMHPTEEPGDEDDEDPLKEEDGPEQPQEPVQSRKAPIVDDKAQAKDKDALEKEEEPEHKEDKDTQKGSDMYPTKEPAGAAEPRSAAKESDTHDEEHPAPQNEDMSPTKAGVNNAQDRALPEAQDAGDAADEEADEGMYPTEDAPDKDNAESDADKYEQDDALEEEEEAQDRAVPVDKRMHPTKSAAASADPAARADGAAESDAGTDMVAPKSTSRSPRAHPVWKRKPSGDSAEYPGYQKPWYSSGNVTNESQLPYEKTKLAAKSQESIKELEARRARLAEESQRRGSSPRLSDDEL